MAKKTPKKSKTLESVPMSEETAKMKSEKQVLVEKKTELALPKVPFKVWSKVSGVKKDQLAGFEFFARKMKYTNLTVPEWKKVYEAFLTKPVK